MQIICFMWSGRASYIDETKKGKKERGRMSKRQIEGKIAGEREKSRRKRARLERKRKERESKWVERRHGLSSFCPLPVLVVCSLSYTRTVSSSLSFLRPSALRSALPLSSAPARAFLAAATK